jgi:hypothetical protein
MKTIVGRDEPGREEAARFAAESGLPHPDTPHNNRNERAAKILRQRSLCNTTSTLDS